MPAVSSLSGFLLFSNGNLTSDTLRFIPSVLDDSENALTPVHCSWAGRDVNPSHCKLGKKRRPKAGSKQSTLKLRKESSGGKRVAAYYKGNRYDAAKARPSEVGLETLDNGKHCLLHCKLVLVLI